MLDKGFKSRFESVGVWLPEARVSSKDLEDQAVSARYPLGLERLTGVRERPAAAEGQGSLDVALGAALDCLGRSRYEGRELDLVVSCSISKYSGDDRRYMFEPTMSHVVAEALGAPHARRFDVSNACAGMLTGMHVARAFIARGSVRRALVVSGERISSIARNALPNVDGIRHEQYASLTVGDAGSAVIMDRAGPGDHQVLGSEMLTAAEYSDLCVGKPNPTGPGAMMSTRAELLQAAAIRYCVHPIRRLLGGLSIDASELRCVIPHQTTRRAIHAGTESLVAFFGSRPQRVVDYLTDTGNTASTSHLIALRREIDAGSLKSGDLVLLLAQASGMVVGGLVFRVDEALLV